MIAQFLFKNPPILLLVILVIVLSGVSSFIAMPRLEDPVLGKRVAVISTIFPGADARRVESLVTIRLEEQLRGIAEIEELYSSSTTGISNIVAELRDDVKDVEPVWSLVRNQLVDAETELPKGCFRPEFEIFPMKAFAAILAVKWQSPAQMNPSISVTAT